MTGVPNNETTQIQEFLNQQREEFLTKQMAQNNNNTLDKLNGNQKTNQLVEPYPQQTKENITTLDKVIKICTHNVRGINKLTDQDNILQELKKSKIDIMGLSETKLTSRAAAFSFKDQDDYKGFHTCNDNSPYGAGTSILVQKHLAKHVHKVVKIDGHILALHFLFKGKKKLIIIQVYLPNDKQKSQALQKHVQKIIDNARPTNTNTIVMGDFNAANNPIVDRTNNTSTKTNNSWKPEISLFPYLEDLEFTDVQKNWEETTSLSSKPSHTWKNRNVSSRIDYIWITHELATNNLFSFNNIAFNHITNSDHTLLQLLLYKKNITNCPSEARTKRRGPRSIFDFKKMDDEKWAEYAQWIEIRLKQLKLLDHIQKSMDDKLDNNNRFNSLQKIWNAIEETIKEAGKKFIPQKKSNKPVNPFTKTKDIHLPLKTSEKPQVSYLRSKKSKKILILKIFSPLIGKSTN